MIHNLIRAAHELIFNRRISNMNSNTVQGAIDELKGTLGYTKKNHFKYITDGFEYNGIVAQKNSDGSMTVSGTATDNVDYQIGVDIYPENEQYILSGYTEGADADCNIYAAYWEDASTWKSAEAVLDDKGVLITKAKGNICKVCLYVAKGKTVNIKFYPMVRYASVKDGSFEANVLDLKTLVTNNFEDITKVHLVNTYDDLTENYRFTAKKKCIVTLSATAYYSNSVPKIVQILKNANLISSNGYYSSQSNVQAISASASVMLNKNEYIAVVTRYQGEARNNLHISGYAQYLE